MRFPKVCWYSLLVSKIGIGLGVEICEDNIDVCHRLGRNKLNPDRCPVIIVKFVRRWLKKELLKQDRIKCNFSTHHSSSTTNMPLYVNESLCLTRHCILVIEKKKKLKRATNMRGSLLVKFYCIKMMVKRSLNLIIFMILIVQNSCLKIMYIIRVFTKHLLLKFLTFSRYLTPIFPKIPGCF